MILDIVKLSKRHTGTNLAVVFQDVLRQYGIENKVSITSKVKGYLLTVF